MSLDIPIITKPKKKKPEQLPTIIGWSYDRTTMEMVIDRGEGQPQRLFELNEMKVLSRIDILTMADLPFVGHEVDGEGLLWIKAFQHALTIAK